MNIISCYKFVLLDRVYPKRYDRVKYRGEWKDCDDFHTIDDSGNGCNCPFVACTGSQECIEPMGFRMFHANNISARRFGRVKSGLNLEIQPKEKFEYSAWVGKIMFLLKKEYIRDSKQIFLTL